jgi:hypothetical protein
MSKKDNIVKWSIVSIFVLLYAGVSIISTIHVIDFFRLSNPEWLAITLAIAFEIGAAACLGAIVILDRTSRWLVWALFVLITGMQMMGNMYYAYSHLQDFQGWIELFGLNEEELIYQKRILSIVSGAILPIVALGFIKSLVDYIRPSDEKPDEPIKEKTHLQKEADRVWADVARRKANGEIQEPTEEELADEPTALANSGYRERAEMEQYEDEEEEEEIEDLVEDAIEDVEGTIDDIQADDSLTEAEKNKKIEKKVKQAILQNPELKEKIAEEIKKLEKEDKYTNTEDSPIANINIDSRRTFGGM